MPSRPNTSGATSLWLNAVHLPTPDLPIPAAVVPYDRDLMHELLDHEAGGVFATRLPDETMAVVPLTAGASLPGPERNLPVADNLRLFAALAREAVFRKLRQEAREKGGYRILTRRPLEVEAAKNPDVVPRDAGLPEWLTKKNVVTFETRIVDLPDTGPSVVLTCSQRLRNVIGASAAELLDRGVELRGLYVSEEATAKDPALDGRLLLAGRVVGRDGDFLLLDDVGSGADRVRADAVHLEPKAANFEGVVRTLTQGRAERLLEEIKRREGDWRSGARRQGRTEGIFGYLARSGLMLARGVPLVFGMMPGNGSSFPPAKVFARPTLSFDPSGTRDHHWAQGRLDEIGPYDRHTFEGRKPRIAVVCEASQRGRTAELMADFLDGLPRVQSRGLYPHKTGLIGRYRLDRPAVEYFEAGGDTAEAYVAACRAALAAGQDRSEPFDLAVVQVCREWKDRLEKDSPYWAAKATFLKREVPVQALALGTAGLGSLEYAMALANASLATYAKLGGTPWLLRARPSTDHELVFGIGSHTRRSGRRGGGERVVGITTVFSSQGSYLLDARTGAVPFDQYPQRLTETLTEVVGRIRREDAWRASDAVRLVFHAFTQVRRDTADAVVKAVEALGLERVSFAFLHVAEEHAFNLLDLGATDGRCRLGPGRGQAVELTDREWLVSLTGREQVRAAGQGVPSPVLLRLHEGSTFKDMGYLARQVSDFSGHSWRTFAPAKAPITLVYADEIARQLAGLDRTPAWDPDALTGLIMRRPWFL